MEKETNTVETETKTREKLTATNMSWKHFESRKRYIKDESGKVTETRYDRLFIGLRPVGRAWLEAHYTGEAPVMVFMLGDKNVVFTHRRGDATVYTNRKAGAQAQEYIKFYVAQLAHTLNCDITEINVIPVDDLPTQTIQRQARGGVDSLDAAIAAACGRTVEDLGI